MHTYTFDGTNKTITLDADESDYVNNTITIEAIDIYRAWKEWCISGDGLKYPPAFRAIGNDPIGGGVYVGSYFFMQEGWKGIPPSRDNVVLILKGNLYTEVQGAMVLGPLPEYTTTLIMQNSSLTQVAKVETDVSSATAEEVWKYNTRELTIPFPSGLDESAMHSALDTYDNKIEWGGKLDLDTKLEIRDTIWSKII